MPICRRTRDWLIEHYKQAEVIVLRFFSDASPVNPQYKAEEEKAIKHLRECPPILFAATDAHQYAPPHAAAPRRLPRYG